MSSDEVFDIVIIGAGIAGLSAAIYSCRLGLKTLIVSVDVGGQLLYAGPIENYPGLEVGSGYDLVFRIRNQATSFGANIVIDEVVELVKDGDVFTVRTKGGQVFKSLSVIAACGKAPKRLGVDGEERFVGRGLSYCVICDSHFFRGKKVVLVSFGVRGAESLQILAPIAAEVHYVTPTEIDESLDVARKYGNVHIHPGYRVVGISGGGVLKVILTNAGGITKELEVNGVFAELGFETRIDFLRKYVDVNESGEVVVGRHCETRVEGLYAAGDLIDVPYKQAVIAAATGAIAALSAVNYVNKVRGLSKGFRADWGKKVSTARRKTFRL